MSSIKSLTDALYSTPDNVLVRVSWLPGGVVDVTAGDLRTALSGQPPAFTPVTLYTTETGVALRYAPGITASVLGRLDKGDAVTRVDASEYVLDTYIWWRVKSSAGITGWAASKFLATNVVPANVWQLPFTASQRGVGLSAGGWAPDVVQLDLIQRNKVEVALICAYERGQAANTVQSTRNVGIKHFIVRAAVNGQPGTPAEFFARTSPVIREYVDAIQPSADKPLMLAIHNEPNIAAEGWGTSWTDGKTFALWYLEVVARFREAYPFLKIGFPALSPGGTIPGIRMAAAEFLNSCGGALLSSDWFGKHAYWTKTDGSDLVISITTPGVPVVVTECGPADGVQITREAVARSYLAAKAANVPVIAWVLDGAGAWGNASWTANNIVLSTSEGL